MIKSALALSRIVFNIGAYAANATLKKVTERDPILRRRFFIDNIGKYSKKALDIIGFKINAVGLEKLDPKENYLFVCNHMSYIDILVLSSVRSFVYVTSVDMGEAPFLGDMAEMGGALFIERRNRSQIGKDIEQIGLVLRAGFDVMLFPEGTSTSGKDVLPFKRSMFTSAISEKKDVVPTVLKYKAIDGKPFVPGENGDRVAWHSDMTFFGHFLGLVKTKSVEVEVKFLNPIKISEFSDKTPLAEHCYNIIRSEYVGQLSESQMNEVPALPPKI